MKIITREILASKASKRWSEQYRDVRQLDKHKIGEKLSALSLPVNPDEVDRIIGNTSWTTPPSCSVCSKNNGPVIEVGDEPDYESNTAWLCFDCVRKIGKMAAAFEGEINEHDRLG